MSTKKVVTTILIWLPSVIMTMFYIPNALNKLLEPDQTGKIVENSAVFITAGIFLLIATALFLYNKTILIGTSMLALYMFFIVLVNRIPRGSASGVAHRFEFRSGSKEVKSLFSLFLQRSGLISDTSMTLPRGSSFHMYKGKPSEVVILILIATIFAAYIRKPQLFHQKQKD